MTTKSKQKNFFCYVAPDWGQFRMTYGVFGLRHLEFMPIENCHPCFSFIEPDGPPFNLSAEGGILQHTAQQLEEYLIGTRKEFNFPFEVSTAFEPELFQVVRSIGYGKTAIYTALADQIGDPFVVKSLVATLMKNPLPLVIPCHRIVAGARDIGGYVWGQKIKQRLLNLETLNRHKITSQ